MKINPFFLFFYVLFFIISCESEDFVSPQINSFPPTTDVYVTGIEDWKACYWKNGQKTNLPGGELINPSQIIVENNDIYVIGRQLIDSTDAIYVNPPQSYFWKNAVKHHVEQYLNLPANTTSSNNNYVINENMEVFDGDLYFIGRVKNPTPQTNQEIWEACYWKNGVKTVVGYLGENTTYSGSRIKKFGNDIYLSLDSNFTFNPNYPNQGNYINWDKGYYKNGVFHNLGQNLVLNDFYNDGVNTYALVQDYSNGPNPTKYYINLDTSTTMSFYPPNFSPPPPLGSIPDNPYPRWNGSDKYLIGQNYYYENNTLTIINDPNGYNMIGAFFVNNQNIYMTRVKSPEGVKLFVNGVETMFMNWNGNHLKGCYNDIFVVQN